MLNKYDKKYKEYLKLRERLDEVGTLIAKIPSVKLDKPYQRGWVIKYDLRPDIKRRKDVADILFILDKGYHKYHFTNDVKTVKAVRKGAKYIEYTLKKKKSRVSLEPGKRRLTEKEYNALPDKFKVYFIMDTSSEIYTKWKRKEYICYLPHYWLLLKARPNIVTHLRGKACDLETEYTQLRSKLQDMWNVYLSNYSSSYPAYKDRTRVRAKIQKFKHGAIDDIYIDKIPRVYDW